MMIRFVCQRVTKSFGLAGLLVAASIGSALAAPPPDRIVRVGLLTSGSNERLAIIERAVTDGLREHGYVEGKNVVLVRRFAPYPYLASEAQAAEIVASKVDVIITGCGSSTKAAMKVAKGTPLVMISVSDPVGRNYVASLARPGGNLTGVSGTIDDLAPKMLDNLHLALPNAKVVGILMNTRSDAHQRSLRAVEATARPLDLVLAPIDLRRIPTEEAARSVFRETGAQALMTLPDDDLFWGALDRILPVSESMRIPTFFFRRDIVDVGGLMSYGADHYDLFRRSGAYVDKIVNGAKPAELPVELPAKVEFSINMKKAEALGTTIPRSLLIRADAILK
jgi:putative tryptophan/tyrosine transport system substrate-binding protein